MKATKVLFAALLLATGLGVTLRPPTAAAEDPIATVIITHADNTSDVGYVYPSSPVNVGWAHITVAGHDAYVAVSTSADKSTLLSQPEHVHTCECTDGPYCKLVVRYCNPGDTCQLTIQGVCSCSATCCG